jgi:hypothetical protein
MFANEKLLDTTAVNLYSQASGASLTVDDEGILYVTWIDETLEWTILNFVKSTDHGQTFAKTVVDSMHVYTQQFFFTPKVHVDKKGNIWLAVYFWDALGGYVALEIRKSTDGGASFSVKYLGYASPYGYDMDSDSLGNIYLVWQPSGRHHRCTKFIDGDLNNTLETPLQFIIFSDRHRIAVHDENIFIVFSVGVADSNFVHIHKTYFTKSLDGGLTFSSPEKIDTSIADSIDQVYPVVYSWYNRLCISWADNRSGYKSVYYKESLDNGNSFTDIVKVSNKDGLNAGSLMAGNSSILGLTWGYWYQNGWNTYFSQKSLHSNTFSTPEKVGDTLYQKYDQRVEDISADKYGYMYILFQEGYLFLSIAKFEISDIEEEQAVSSFSLYQNYPNPFNASTLINYELITGTFITLKVFSITGEEVAELAYGWQPHGVHSVRFNSKGLPSGVYFYRLQAGEVMLHKKMIVLK